MPAVSFPKNMNENESKRGWVYSFDCSFFSSFSLKMTHDDDSWWSSFQLENEVRKKNNLYQIMFACHLQLENPIKCDFSESCQRQEEMIVGFSSQLTWKSVKLKAGITSTWFVSALPPVVIALISPILFIVHRFCIAGVCKHLKWFLNVIQVIEKIWMNVDILWDESFWWNISLRLCGKILVKTLRLRNLNSCCSVFLLTCLVCKRVKT